MTDDQAPTFYALFWKEHSSASPRVQIEATLEAAIHTATYLEKPKESFDYRDVRAYGTVKIAKFTGEWIK